MIVALALAALAAGLIVLTRAADHFVLGAARLAGHLSISPVVIGAIVLGFGTSAPELLVSGVAASQGDTDLGIGNIVGSNIANLTLVLGAAALLAPLPLPARTIRREAPLAIVAGGVFAVTVQGGLSRLEGAGLLVLMVGAITWLLLASSDQGEVDADDESATEPSREAGRAALGLAGTLVGAQLVVWGAGELAEAAGLDSGVVGLTLVALGTSLPELVTVVAAARQQVTGLVIGNLLGSNLFNSLSVGAAVGLLGGGAGAGSAVAGVGVGVMVAVSLVALVFMATQRRVVRWEGAVMLALYVGTVATVGVGG